MTVFAGIMLLVMQLFAPFAIHAFVRDSDVIELGGRALKLTSCFYVFLGLIYVSRGILNGVGDGLFAFINGTIEIVGRIGLPLLLMRITSLGVWSIWWTVGLTWLISAVFCMLRYIRYMQRKQAAPAISNVEA